ncbi:MAG TPA: type II toxin-antitoxin system Phd/YefM family antitoxin [Terriglobales bacterium]|nr:type II toxin-antitoxin system Phd/YefM family antitoxin [Terriglobales bacterium]
MIAPDWLPNLVIMREISASDFKAKCLAILDEVAATGEPVMVLKRGRPVAQLVPPIAASGQSPQAELTGTIRILGDVVSPAVSAKDWDAEGSGE